MAASPVPIISGVGHETDFTLTDFAADLRAATPTAAAELATPITIAELRGATDHYTHLLDSKIRDVLDEYYARVDDFSVRLNYLSPRRRVQQGQQNVDMRLQRLGAAQVQRQRLMREQLSGLMRRLDALNPQAVLARGYAILTAAEDGRLVDSIGKAKKDDRIKIRVKDGEFDAKIS